MHVTSAVLTTMELIAASLGVGSMVCIAVVAKVTRIVLDGPSQMVFLRSMNRRYSVVGATPLLVFIASALALLWSLLSSSGTAARHSTLARPDVTSRSTRLLASKFQEQLNDPSTTSFMFGL